MDPRLVSELTLLYRSATTLSLQEFPDWLIRQTRQWIGFDGATLGFGQCLENGQLLIGHANVFGRNPEMLTEYADVNRLDPVTQRFLTAPANLQRIDLSTLYDRLQSTALQHFAHRHDLRHLLLLGEPCRRGQALRWIVLYRGTHQEFLTGDSSLLIALWPHLLCALDINRSRVLDLNAPPLAERALALINREGFIEVADSTFLTLLSQTWPQFDGTRLPSPAQAARCQGKIWSGTHLTLSFTCLGHYALCHATRRNRTVPLLTPREQEVARLFVAGNTHKAVAQQLGRSPNTVRSQLASIYQKLGLRDKAMLAIWLKNQQADDPTAIPIHPAG